MRDDNAEPAEPPNGQMTGMILGERHIRMLRIAVIIMSVILVVGFIAVIARIIYLVNRGGDTAAPTAVSQPLQQAARLALPSGANVRQISLAGSRLAVHYDSPTGSGIIVLDLHTGNPVSRVEIVPETPR